MLRGNVCSSYVFVYGTLMSGMENHYLIESYVVSIRPGTVKGRLVHLPVGYPMLFRGEQVVVGEIVELNGMEVVLQAMDQLEDYHSEDSPDNLYVRRRITALDTEGGKQETWVYICPEDKEEEMLARGIHLPHGNWRLFISDF